jgi:hypothetical protein
MSTRLRDTVGSLRTPPSQTQERPSDNAAEPTEPYTVETAISPSKAANGQFLPGNRLGTGRPKAQFSPTALLRQIVEERGGSFVYKLYDQADAGDFRSQELVMAYLDGKPIQRQIEVTASVQMDSLVDGLKADLQGLLPQHVVVDQLPEQTST